MIRFAEALSASHEGRDRIQFLEASAKDLPIPDATATVVLVINSLHHWQDTKASLAGAVRSLKPGGRLFVSAEEPHDGRFGHGDGQLSDPASAARTIENAGLFDVSLSKDSEDEIRLFLAFGRKLALHGGR